MKSIAVITGASRGIGYETSIALAEKGVPVLAVARSEEPLKELGNRYPKLITPFPTDLLDSNQRDAIVNYISNENLSVSILMNNAGLLCKKDLKEISEEDWDQMFAIHVKAPFFLTRALLPYFADGAHVVNVGSMGGFQGSAKFPGLMAYSTAKGAMTTMSECFAVEFAQQDISVNCLCLGAVQTEMLAEAFPGFNAPVDSHQMGRYIAHFAMEAGSLYNGQVLPVNLADPE